MPASNGHHELPALIHRHFGRNLRRKLASQRDGTSRAIGVRLELAENHRYLALFNLAIDSKLCGCDLVKVKVVDVMASGQIKERAPVL